LSPDGNKDGIKPAWIGDFPMKWCILKKTKIPFGMWKLRGGACANVIWITGAVKSEK
jgi:hypothetical protein